MAVMLLLVVIAMTPGQVSSWAAILRFSVLVGVWRWALSRGCVWPGLRWSVHPEFVKQRSDCWNVLIVADAS